jgi:hypothetical protein
MLTPPRPLKATPVMMAAVSALCLLTGFGAQHEAAPAVSATTASATTAPAQIAELWVEPRSPRDLFHGPGGAALAPDPRASYKVIAIKVGGFSDGYTLEDPNGREWSAKFPPEAYTEVVASRIHWGVGYHQPPIYFLREWTAENANAPNPQLPARFREKDPDFHGLNQEGAWSFADNPFVGTRELAGLLVLQAMLGNSDLKDSNNTHYTLKEPVYGAARWYTTRDIGHTFGRTGVIDAPRGDIAVFEVTPFIHGVEGDRVVLEYGGRHKKLFANIKTADVRWICQQLNRLTDKQWQDAFRAGGYEPTLASRFIARLKQKIGEGLALPQ